MPLGPLMLPQLTDAQFRAIVIVGAVLTGILVILLRFCSDPTMPPKPPIPPVPQGDGMKTVSQIITKNKVAYESLLKQDAKRFGAKPITAEEIGRKLVHRVEDRRYELSVKRPSVEVVGLKLTVKIRRSRRNDRKQLLLQIRNMTSMNLAYQIDTSREHGSRACRGRDVLDHNATAIRPREVITRVECLYRKGWKSVKIHRVETVELPDLSYYYISSLRPENIGLNSRVTKGHTPSVPTCDMSQSASLAHEIRQGNVQWFDFIDFFARHSCKDYRFPPTYRAFESDHQKPLPVTR